MIVKIVGTNNEIDNKREHLIECKDYYVSQATRAVYFNSTTDPETWKFDVSLYRYDHAEIYGMENGKTINKFVWIKEIAKKLTEEIHKTEAA